VLGANKNKLPKGNWKDSGKQKCVSERILTWAAPRKSREREMVEPVDDWKCHGWVQKRLKYADEIQSCTAPNSQFTKNVAEY